MTTIDLTQAELCIVIKTLLQNDTIPNEWDSARDKWEKEKLSGAINKMDAEYQKEARREKEPT